MFSIKNIKYQLSHPKSKGECEQYRLMLEPKKPRRSDYFPEELTDCLLSEVLVRVAGVSYIDGLPVS